MKSLFQRYHEAKSNGRTGQTLIFMSLILLILLFVALWNFDLHKVLFVKSLSRNAGDSAALAAARWQGITLNLIGELNVMQAVALTDGLASDPPDFEEARAIADLQARLNFVGPLVGLVAAQQAAKNNQIFSNNTYTDELYNHGLRVIDQYDLLFDQPWENDPPTPTAWDDYGEMLVAIANNQIAAYPENRRLFNDFANYDHMLLNPDFYDAIGTRNWCWFQHNALALLQNYNSWMDWPDLPELEPLNPINSEYFGLNLRKISFLDPVAGFAPGADSVDDIIDAMRQEADGQIRSEISVLPATWFVYNPSAGFGGWGSWKDAIGEGFPFNGDIRDKYDYTGADAAIRIDAFMETVTPGADNKTIVWTAAAKPFGYLEGDQRPNDYGVVLPAFRDVRMIPVDTSSAPAGGSHPGWVDHVYYHLDDYMDCGPGCVARFANGGCYYCQQLITWEFWSFRQEGVDWLRENRAQCYRRPGGGGGGGGGGDGGTRRGH